MLGKSAPKLFTTEFVKEGWGLLFTGAKLALHDDDWMLAEHEADELTRRTIAWVDSIDPKTLERFEKKYGKHAPAVSLIIGLGAIAGPRALGTLAKRRARRANLRNIPRVPVTVQAPEQNAPVAERHAPSSDRAGSIVSNDIAPASGASPVEPLDTGIRAHAERSDDASGPALANTRERPITRDSFHELFRETDDGTV